MPIILNKYLNIKRKELRPKIEIYFLFENETFTKQKFNRS